MKITSSKNPNPSSGEAVQENPNLLVFAELSEFSDPIVKLFSLLAKIHIREVEGMLQERNLRSNLLLKTEAN